jgi:serine/threonine-protein kinase
MMVTREKRERFLHEAQISAGLDHPNLLRVHDSGEAGGILYQAMDLLEGSDLARTFAEGPAVLTGAETLHHGAGLCRPGLRA